MKKKKRQEKTTFSSLSLYEIWLRCPTASLSEAISPYSWSIIIVMGLGAELLVRVSRTGVATAFGYFFDGLRHAVPRYHTDTQSAGDATEYKGHEAAGCETERKRAGRSVHFCYRNRGMAKFCKERSNGENLTRLGEDWVVYFGPIGQASPWYYRLRCPP